MKHCVEKLVLILSVDSGNVVLTTARHHHRKLLTMSKNRENVVWQSKDGTWSIGFYEVIEGDVFDPDYDDEWDVDYDFSKFWWASTGHATETAAMNSWHGANPGSHTVCPYRRGNTKDIAEYNEMVKCLRDPAYAAAKAAKAERAALRKVAAKAEARIAESKIGEGDRVSVSVGTGYNYRSFTAYLVREGDWLGVRNDGAFAKVYNTKTKKVWMGKRSFMNPTGGEATVVSIERYRVGRYSYSGW